MDVLDIFFFKMTRAIQKKRTDMRCEKFPLRFMADYTHIELMFAPEKSSYKTHFIRIEMVQLISEMCVNSLITNK